MKEAKVIFDWDGVFNIQVYHLCHMLNIPVPNRYHVKKATNLTPDEAERLFQSYFTTDAYTNVPFVDGVERALALPCVPYIYSANTSEFMAEYKYNMARVFNPLLPDSHIILPISRHKPPIEDAAIVIEDGVHYLQQYSKSTIKILIDTPYNQEAPDDIIRVATLTEAIDLIEELLSLGNTGE